MRIKLKIWRLLLELIAINFVFILVIGTLSYTMIESYLEDPDKSVPKIIIRIVVFSFMLFYILWVNRGIMRKFPFVYIDNECIIINKIKFEIDSITDIQLFGKFQFRGISYQGSSFFSAYREGLRFKTSDGKEIILFDLCYYNLFDLKIKLNKGLIEDNPISNSNFITNKVFRNSQFKTIRGFILWGSISFILIYIFSFYNSLWNISGLIAIMIILGSIFFYHSQFMSYFSLSDKILTIKKENMSWYSIHVPLENIAEIVFDYHITRPFSYFEIKQLRIVFRDFKQKTYPADLLTKKNWSDLEKELLARGIRIRNDRDFSNLNKLR